MARTVRTERTEKERLRLELSQESFAEWVRRRPSGAEVGIAGSAVDSPEVRWVREISGLHVLSDGSLIKTWNKPGGVFVFALVCPTWMRRLVREMDDTPDGPVGREDVLEVLKKI